MIERLTAFLTQKPTKGRRFLFLFLALAVTVAVLGWLVWSQRDVIPTIDWQIRPQFFLLSMLAYTAALVMVALVWSSILAAFGSRVAPLKNILYFLITNVGKRLPGTIWYVAWRAQIYHQENYPVALTSLASSVELAVLIVSGVIVGLGFMAQQLQKIEVGLWILGLIGAACVALLHPRILSAIIRKLSKAEVKISYSKILGWIAVYLVVWLLGGISLFCIGNGFVAVPISALLYVVESWAAVGVLSFMLLFLPTNLGFNEIGLSFLLTQVMAAPIAVVVALASRVLTTIYDIVIALVAFGVDSLQKKGDV